MNLIKLEYQARLKEFDILFKHLSILETQWVPGVNKIIIVNSIKSSLILMLYNLIEYSIKNIVELIELEFEKEDFIDFTEDFQSIFLKTFWIYLDELDFLTIKKIISQTDFISNILDNSIKYWYKNENLTLNSKCKIRLKNSDWQIIWISGNIDYNKIYNIGKFLDLKVNYTNKVNANIDILESIKRKRNELSHWSLSFNALWKDIWTNDLMELRDETDKFLKWFFQRVEDYLIDKPYLK